MKHLFFIILLAFSIQLTLAQTVFRHSEYISTFNDTLFYPQKVEYWETKAKSTCTNPIPRENCFICDPLYCNLTNHYSTAIAGYDRGHLSPARSNACLPRSQYLECFYFSNVIPQLSKLNRGSWKNLETLIFDKSKTMDSIYVICGAVGSLKMVSTIHIPKYCWKIYYIKKTKEIHYFIFSNSIYQKYFDRCEVEKSVLERYTGLNFDYIKNL
jgi:DNA/RNA endonuclease G (NUC1)